MEFIFYLYIYLYNEEELHIHVYDESGVSWTQRNLSMSVCDSRKLIDSVLLCHHSKDEQKVTKLKQSLQELGPVTVHSRDEGSAVEGGGFSEDLVIFCLSVEYVQSSEQFVRGRLRADRDSSTCCVCLHLLFVLFRLFTNDVFYIHLIYVYTLYVVSPFFLKLDEHSFSQYFN